MEKIEPSQFKELSGQSQKLTELRERLRKASLEERIEFIKELWPLNAKLALSLTLSSQIPITHISGMLREWLLLNIHNSAKLLIDELAPVLGKDKFWKIAASLELTVEME